MINLLDMQALFDGYPLWYRILGVVGLIILFVLVLARFYIQPVSTAKAKNEIQPISQHMVKSPESVQIGTLHYNPVVTAGVVATGPIQINQQRGVYRNPVIDKSRLNQRYVIRVSFTQSLGFWDNGTEFRLAVKFSGPFIAADIVSGFPSGYSSQTTQNLQSGEFSFVTTTAPLANQPIVLEVHATHEIELLSYEVLPGAPSG